MFEYRSNPFRNENENTNLYNPQRQILKGKSQILNKKVGSLKTSQSFNNTTKLFNNKQTTRQRSVFGRINSNINVNNQNNLNQRKQNNPKVYLKRSVSQRAVTQNTKQQLNQNKVRQQPNPNPKKKANQKKKKKIIYNIDKPNMKNPQYVTELVDDIYKHKKKKEIEQMLPINFLSNQKVVNDKVRGTLLDWLCEVHLKFKLKTEVLYLTCKIIDKLLSKVSVPIRKLQLTGLTAMLIASKYEEIYPPEVNDFVYISDNTYTREQIINAEAMILNVLNFRVTYVSPYFFIQRYIKAAGVGLRSTQYLKLKLLSNYLLELSIPRVNMVKYKPSQLAAAAVYLALVSLNTKTLNKPLLWTDTLQYYTKFKLSEILKCARDLRKIAIHVAGVDLNDENEFLSARKKYIKKRFARVSQVPIRIV
ncbi:cyclin-b1-4 [Anaeramoeba flamelloides]|uniref:Cyclin-b1-4 n=1 Tax=Anaeramoeba flamelloides TaxID=1746091 RepID=A0AAV7YDY7_9EUKA|nr:cyclin-b1-4 [Anaeramoeba flamelloides]